MSNWFLLWGTIGLAIILFSLMCWFSEPYSNSRRRMKVVICLLIICLIGSICPVLILRYHSSNFCESYFDLLAKVNRVQYLEPEQETQYISPVIEMNANIQTWQTKYEEMPFAWNFYDERIENLQPISLYCLDNRAS